MNHSFMVRLRRRKDTFFQSALIRSKTNPCIYINIYISRIRLFDVLHWVDFRAKPIVEHKNKSRVNKMSTNTCFRSDLTWSNTSLFSIWKRITIYHTVKTSNYRYEMTHIESLAPTGASTNGVKDFPIS